MEQMTTKQTIRPKITLAPNLKTGLILSLGAFFIGRVIIFQNLNPIVPAFLGCLSFLGSGFYLSLIFSFLGLLTKWDTNCLLKYIIFFTIMLALNIAVPRKKREKSLPFRCCIATTATLVSGLIYALINSFSFYYTVLAILEAVLCFSLFMVLERGVSLMAKRNTTALMPEKEDIISVALIIGAVLAGASDLNISGVDMAMVLATFSILTIGYVYGIAYGAVASIMVTLILYLSSAREIELMCIFACSIVFASLGKSFKKVLFSLCFTASAFILSLYMKKELLSSEYIFSYIIAVIIFLLLPLKKYEQIKPKATNAEEYISRLRALTTQRLKDFSSSFYKLSKTLTSLSQSRNNSEKKEVSAIIDDVAAVHCVKCNMRNFCWENNFYNTYQTIFTMLSACEEKGFAEEKDLGDSFLTSCIKKDKFIATINRMYELHKTNKSWQNKINESRELVSQQLEGVSSIINELSNELSLNISYNERLSQRAEAILEENSIFVNSLVITEAKDSQTEILIKHPPCYGAKDCEKYIIPILSQSLKKHFCKECVQCVTSRENRQNICTLRLVEEKNYHILPAVASTKKDGSYKSGDSTTFIPLPEGKYLLALSDGMGSGSFAKKESAATLELFEDFISAGFNKSTAINMINSVLVLKAGSESFSTLDVCTIDLFKAEAEFIKIGAVTSFIKHEDSVEVIKSNSLPVGILSSVEPESYTKRLADNDIIIMISDGILDSSNSLNNKEGFIISILESTTSNSPSEIADKILNAAIENSKGSVDDDMTVLAARISKRRL